jgi:hypothetical protein
MRVLTSQVRYFTVTARNKPHAYSLAEAEYTKQEGLPAAFLECYHAFVGCIRQKGGSR